MEARMVPVANGISLASYQAGDPAAPTMLLLHALGEQSASWDSVVPRFVAGFHVVMLDLRGHGASDWPGTYSFELMRDDVIEVLDDLALHNIILVGHSMGGMVAYLLAQARPDVISRLIIEDAIPPYPRTRPVPERPPGVLPFDWAVVPAIGAQVDDPSLRWWKYLSDIVSPTLLIGGGPASHIPREKLVEASLLMPDCTLITIPAGHNIHESEPEAFTDAVLSWLDPPHLSGKATPLRRK